MRSFPKTISEKVEAALKAVPEANGAVLGVTVQGEAIYGLVAARLGDKWSFVGWLEKGFRTDKGELSTGVAVRWTW